MTKKEYYKSLAEIKLLDPEEYLAGINKIMTATGVLIKMESDIIEFLKKSKPTKKSEEQLERIEIIREVLNHFYRISSINAQLIEVNRINNAWMIKVQKENEELKEENIKLNGILNAE